jgi:uncharacterized protein (DUF2141 family)
MLESNRLNTPSNYSGISENNQERVNTPASNQNSRIIKKKNQEIADNPCI